MTTVEDFAGCRSIPESNIRFKELFAERITGPGLDPFGPEAQQLGYSHTAVLTRMTYGAPVVRGERSTAPRKALHEQLARPNEDEGTITCTGACGQDKPVKKFPTARGGIGRLSVCRECRDAAIAERKAGHAH